MIPEYRNYFTNPLNPHCADNYVAKFGDYYYMVGTPSTEDAFKTLNWIGMWISRDMVTWCGPINVYNGTIDDTPIWAPEIYHYNGYYYILAACGEGKEKKYNLLLRAEAPEGPYTRYTDLNKLDVDPDIFVDTDGKSYIFSGKFINTLSDDWKAQGEAWKDLDPGNYREGNFFIKNNNRYLMFMATYNKYPGVVYPMEMSYSDTIYGPYVFWNKNPFYAGQGPGHGSMTVSPDGSELWVCSHNDSDTFGGGWSGRCLAMDKFIFDSDGFPIPIIRDMNPQKVPSKAILNGNIAKGKPVNASDFAGSSLPSNAVDGNEDSLWEAANDELPKYLDVDTMGEFKVKQFITVFKSPGIYKYKILGSYDRYGWTTLADRTGNTSSQQTFIDDNHNDLYFRYFKLEITGNAGTGTTGVREFKVINGGTPAIDYSACRVTSIECRNWSAKSDGIYSESCSEGGLNIRNTIEGDWVSYDNIELTAGNYDILFRVASNYTSNSWELYDGDKIAASYSFGSTNGNQYYENVIAFNVHLSEGSHNFKLVFNDNHCSFEYFQLIATDDVQNSMETEADKNE